MQGSQLLTVRQVATALGIDDRSVREKLQLGTLKGTKKTVGQKEQWFVYQRDLAAELARRGLLGLINQPPQQAELTYAPAMTPPPQPVQQATVTLEPEAEEHITDATILEASAAESIFDTGDAEVDSSTSGGNPRSWRNEDLENQVMATAEKFMKPLIDRVQELTKESLEKDLIIEEQKKQLLLLPDLETQRARLLNEIEAERKAAEIQFAKAAEKEQEAKALEAENEQLKQKAQEAILSAAKLADLEKVVQELQKPKPGWFKRLFLPTNQG
jgi:hypothetical protein